MQDFILLAIFILLGGFFLAKCLKYFFTPLDDLYSDFRNTKDYGYEKFLREIWFKRIVYISLAALFLGMGFYKMFS